MTDRGETSPQPTPVFDLDELERRARNCDRKGWVMSTNIEQFHAEFEWVRDR